MKVSNICGSSVKETTVAALYQPSSDKKEKPIWIEKLDKFVSILNSTWNKTYNNR